MNIVFDKIKKVLIKLKKTFLTKNFLEFSFIGAFNTLTAASFSWLSHICRIQSNVSAVIGYAVSLLVAYMLNCKITFKSAPSIRGYLRFVISYIPNFIIYFLVTFITINTWHLPQFWGTVLAAMAGGPITFIIIKIYAFGRK